MCLYPFCKESVINNGDTLFFRLRGHSNIQVLSHLYYLYLNMTFLTKQMHANLDRFMCVCVGVCSGDSFSSNAGSVSQMTVKKKYRERETVVVY